MKTLRQILLLLFVSFCMAYSCRAQINSVWKAAESLNADSTTIRNYAKADSMAQRETGWIYFNNQSNKWRICTVVGPAPFTITWRDLGTAAGDQTTASNGLTEVGNDIRLGGTLTGNTTIAQAGFNTSFTGTGKVTFSPSATLSGLNTGSIVGSPSTPSDGDLWFDSTLGNLRFYGNSSSRLITSNDAGLSSSQIPFFTAVSSNLTGSSSLTFTGGSNLNTVNLVASGRGTFTTSATLPGLNPGTLAGDPSSLTNGDIWYNSTTNRLRVRTGGASFNVGQGDGTITGTLGTNQVVYGTGATAIGSEAAFNYNPATNVLNAERITATPTATTPGLNPGSFAGDPSTPTNGDLWYNSTSNNLRARINGASVSLAAATPPAGSNTQIQYNNSGAFGAEAAFVYDQSTNTMDADVIQNSATVSTMTVQGRAATNSDVALTMPGTGDLILTFGTSSSSSNFRTTFLPSNTSGIAADAIWSDNGLMTWNNISSADQKFKARNQIVFDFPNTASLATSIAGSTATVTGARVGDFCLISVNTSSTTNPSYSCQIIANDTVQFQFTNISGAAVDPPSYTFGIQVIEGGF